MTINTAWQIEIGSVASPTDFSSRVLSMSIDQSVDVNVVGRGSCSITLLNKDGALTPGGGGTYSTTDWFAQGVFVSSLTNIGAGNTKTAVFHGIIVDFDLVDDGVFSTVTITAQDGLTIAGRTNSVAVGGGTVSYNTAAAYALAEISPYPLKYPHLGQLSAGGSYNNLSGSNPDIYVNNQTFNSYADLYQTALVPSVNDVFWATTITNTVGVDYRVQSCPVTMTRTDANATTFEFVPSGTVTSTKLPFSNYGFSQQFNNETLITQVNILGVFVGATTSTVNSTDIDSYGNRTVSFTNTFVGTQEQSDAMANNLINRYSDIRFTPSSLEITDKMVKANCADAALSQWYNLLSIANGLWQKVLVTWAGSGIGEQTISCVISGRSINVTPAQTVVSLSLKSGIDNQSFILDNSNFGVLGGDPITYNQPEISYNEAQWTYNDSYAEQGNRLG
jgi:hypothetical protein